MSSPPSSSPENVVGLDHLLVDDVLADRLQLGHVAVQRVAADGAHLLLNLRLHFVGNLFKFKHLFDPK